jgi:hypothetical protein
MGATEGEDGEALTPLTLSIQREAEAEILGAYR